MGVEVSSKTMWDILMLLQWKRRGRASAGTRFDYYQRRLSLAIKLNIRRITISTDSLTTMYIVKGKAKPTWYLSNITNAM